MLNDHNRELMQTSMLRNIAIARRVISGEKHASIASDYDISEVRVRQLFWRLVSNSRVLIGSERHIVHTIRAIRANHVDEWTKRLDELEIIVGSKC